MAKTRFVPLEAPSLFPDQDWRPWIEQTQSNASGGQLTDFSPSSPVVALNEGFYWSWLEALYYANRLPKAFAIQHLKIAGVMRRLGAPAKTTLTFTLTAPIGYFQLSAGYRVQTPTGLEFQTDADLFILNSYQGTVTATAVADGSQYNVAAYTITQITETRAFLQGVINTEPAGGGLDEETEQEVITRGFEALRDRGVLITRDDFERYARKVLGAGATVKVVGRLGADRTTLEKGAVHVFALNPDGSELTAAQAITLAGAMNNQSPVFLQGVESPTIASAVYASSISLYALEVMAIAALVPGDNPEARATLINANLTEYLRPGNLEPGATIILKELENVVRQSGVAWVESVSSLHAEYVENAVQLDTFYNDVPLATDWTAAYLLGCHIDLVNVATKEIYTFDFGDGGDKD